MLFQRQVERGRFYGVDLVVAYVIMDLFKCTSCCLDNKEDAIELIWVDIDSFEREQKKVAEILDKVGVTMQRMERQEFLEYISRHKGLFVKGEEVSPFFKVNLASIGCNSKNIVRIIRDTLIEQDVYNESVLEAVGFGMKNCDMRL